MPLKQRLHILAVEMATYHVRQRGRGNSLSDYWPLFALVGVSAGAGATLSLQGMQWMPAFMGVF